MATQKNSGTFGFGNTAKKGKPSPGSGRPPNWLRAHCEEIIERSKLFNFLGEVVSGAAVEKTFDAAGNILLSPAATRDRLKAAEMLLDRAYGKPAQPLDHSGELAGRMIIVRPKQ